MTFKRTLLRRYLREGECNFPFSFPVRGTAGRIKKRRHTPRDGTNTVCTFSAAKPSGAGPSERALLSPPRPQSVCTSRAACIRERASCNREMEGSSGCGMNLCVVDLSWLKREQSIWIDVRKDGSGEISLIRGFEKGKEREMERRWIEYFFSFFRPLRVDAKRAKATMRYVTYNFHRKTFDDNFTARAGCKGIRLVPGYAEDENLVPVSYI